jgi:Flp pilus assembly protein TadD
MNLRPCALTLLTLATAAAFAAGDGGGNSSSAPPKAADPDIARAVEAIKAERYAEAIPGLLAVVERSKNNADAHNWLGYAYRQSGNLDAAFVHYDRALAIEPKHLGAHEYLGEAWLMAGKLAKAEEQLKILDGLCWLPCEEHSDLKRAIAEYKARQGAAK